MSDDTKFGQTPTEVAVAALLSAADGAARAMESTIITCGNLSGDESRQSKSGKAYFADQALVYKEALKVLQGFRRELSSKQ
jgi:hypothetical protein